ncbi:piggyBac transposable element-derived protein 4-like [Periplaneta americana]|uniref:piggyBac transposable element-derived protein 4-like n=1 Tax=Periplaneta americana TaxID=6978 RepID=UPI0037E7405A
MGTENTSNICEWLDEDLDDGIENESDDESNREDLLNEVHDSNSEQDNEDDDYGDDERLMSINDGNCYTGRDNTTIWQKEPVAQRGRRRAQNVVIHLPGPKRAAKNARTHTESFDCFIDKTIINVIVRCTNIYIEKVKRNYGRDRDCKLTNDVEIRALLGILYLAGALKSGRLNVRELWDKNGTGIESIYLTMTYNRFQFLLRCLRFDNIHDRQERKVIDKLAAVREVFELFVQNSQRCYIPSEYVTIDEQLVAFRGRCPMKVCMPTKPTKYGIKIFAMVDVKTYYTHNLEIYAGIQPDGPFHQSNSAHAVVKRLVHPIKGTGRNVTTDNWFTSIPLSLDLLENDNITLVGTLKKNKREIPRHFTTTQDRQVNSTLFGFNESCTIISYVPKKNKTVLALSTMHYDKAMDEETGGSQKPEIISFYNRTKCAVDVLDQLCSAYDVSRNSRRWPLTIFFDLLNIAGVNALVVYSANNQKMLRKNFLKTLALDLMKPLIFERITRQTIPREIKRRGEQLLGIPQTSQEEGTRPGGIGRCYMCGRTRNKSTRQSCFQCLKRICPTHSDVICLNCVEEMRRSTQIIESVVD